MKKFGFPICGAGSRSELRWIGYSAITALALLIVDQLTKLLVLKSFKLYESHPVVDGIFSITYVRNNGAAWSILSGHQLWLLLFAFVVLAALIWFFRYLTDGYSERILALALMISGIVGNSIDRLWHNEVIDFLDVHYYDVWNYPVFNVADMAICCGVGLFILSSLLRRRKEQAS